ncbi:hypothetical protein MNBD_GAMMA22-3092 [hydrothermal vent metagenome]|uniref:Uncharacterized protein n=1 Tax=hydrothermal vent metagenome TaxID=652676 RepID=A0A3B1APB5_9ZZZZ
MSQIDDSTTTLVQQIADYLARHPHAADTVEGIARWWLPQQPGVRSVERVSRSLEYMLKNNLISRRTLSDGREIYTTTK